jgi:hypothetical protein
MTDLSFLTPKNVAAIKASEATGMFQAIGSGSNRTRSTPGVETPTVSPNA